MIRFLWSGFFIALVLSGCGIKETPTRKNDFTPLTSIEIHAVSQTIASQTSTRLTVTGNYSGLFTGDITNAVWSIDAPTVAGFVTAADLNRVTGLAPGTANLTATVKSVTGALVSATFKLTVSSATIRTITINPDKPSIAKGRNIQFAASGAFSDTTTQDMTLDAIWASSDTTVATISNDPGSKGLVQAHATGASKITAVFGNISGNTLLTVTAPVLQSITVSSANPSVASPANPSVLTLSTASFTAMGKYSDGTSADITNQVAWTSSNTAMATISANGVATTLTQGSPTISATLNGVTGTSTLKVTGGNLTGITLAPSNLTLVNNTVARITATGAFSNGASRDITGAVTWSTGNAIFANMTTPGGNLAWLRARAVTPVSNPTTVTATYGAVTGTTFLTVTAPTLSSITVSPASLDLTAGTSGRFTLTATFNDGTPEDVTYSSDWTSSAATTASVGNVGIDKGRVTGVASAVGSVTINATYGGLTTLPPPAVTVTARTLQSLTISGASNVSSGNQFQFSALANYSDGTVRDVTADTVWTIDNHNVAILADSVNQPGLVIWVDTGSMTLTASFGGINKTASFTVP